MSAPRTREPPEGRRKGDTPPGFCRPWRDCFRSLPMFPSDQLPGYCLSPSGLRWPRLSVSYPLRTSAPSAVKDRFSRVSHRFSPGLVRGYWGRTRYSPPLASVYRRVMLTGNQDLMSYIDRQIIGGRT